MPGMVVKPQAYAKLDKRHAEIDIPHAYGNPPSGAFARGDQGYSYKLKTINLVKPKKER